MGGPTGRWTQVGIAVGMLGIVITLIGLFPGITGIEDTPGIGLVQILTILTGFSALIGGAFMFAQSAFYPGQQHTLAQEIGVRISLTGLLGAAAAGLADVLGYGSNNPAFSDQHPVLGAYQSIGLIGGFLVAALGVLIFVLMGEHPDDSD